MQEKEGTIQYAKIIFPPINLVVSVAFEDYENRFESNSIAFLFADEKLDNVTFSKSNHKYKDVLIP